MEIVIIEKFKSLKVKKKLERVAGVKKTFVRTGKLFFYEKQSNQNLNPFRYSGKQ